MGLVQACDHDGPGGRLFRFCGACGTLIHPQTPPLPQCDERHGMKQDVGYQFCVDCGGALTGDRGRRPAPSASIDAAPGGARILEFPAPVRE